MLSAFERSFPLAPKWLVLHEFDGPDVLWKDLAFTDETAWAKKIIPRILRVDFACFKLTGIFEKPERPKL